MSTTLNLKKFDMNEIKDDKVVVLIGKRDTGKSFLCRDILYRHRGVPVGQVISGTEGANQFYSKMVPKLFIHDEFKPEIVENILKRQKIMIKQYAAFISHHCYLTASLTRNSLKTWRPFWWFCSDMCPQERNTNQKF